MTPEDRDLLAHLRAEELDLREALARLESRLGALEVRAAANGTVMLPPIPLLDHGPAVDLPPLPPLPPLELPPIPAAELPPVPVPAAKVPREFRVGRWLTRLGALFFVLLLISLDAFFHLHRYLGRAGQLAILGGLSVTLVAFGRHLRGRALTAYGNTLLAAGLGGLYVTLYAATAVPPWQLVTHPLAGGLVLLLWSVYVFDLARRMTSQPLALIALLLAYITTAMNPSARFSLGADLLLGGTAVAFLLRFGWQTTAWVGLAGTYLAITRRLLFDENGQFTFDTSRALAFAPHAVYLMAAWGTFTAGVLLAPRLRVGGRHALLTINNALGAGLLVLSAIICGYGDARAGWVLLLSGGALLGTAVVARIVRPETAGAFGAQGLALATGGIMTVSTGATRGVLLLVETLVLAIGGAISRNRILEAAGWVVATFTTGFLLWDVAVETRDPWVLGLGGSAVMLKGAWLTRQRQRAPHFAWPATLYSVLGLILLGALLATQLGAEGLPPALALCGLAATLLGFALKLGELPPVAQVYVLAAQGLAIFPTENGEPISGWSGGWVVLATLATMLVIRRTWLRLLDPLYALGLVGLIDHLVRPHVSGPAWMITASALSLAFLFIGAASRIGSLAAAGQLFLLAAVIHFFHSVPTTPWAAAIPLAAVFATGRLIHGWLRTTPELTGTPRQLLRIAAFFYQLLALVMLVDALVVLVPPRSLAPLFLLLGTLVLSINTQRLKSFGVRCSFVLSGLGAVLILFAPVHAPLTFLGTLAILSFLTQPMILAHAPRALITATESWALVLVSSLTGWVALAGEASARWGAGAITASWAVCALVLFLAGFLLHESRQRWCGLAILLVTIVRVFAVDFWGLSAGFRVLTFFVLTLVTLGLGFLYARYPDRVKTLL
jgi:hypothetical protein